MGGGASKVQDSAPLQMSNKMSMEKITKLFNTLDDNDSKKLDYNEFAAMWTIVGLKPDDKPTKIRVFERYDVNNDGVIDLKEFKDFIESLDIKAGAGALGSEISKKPDPVIHKVKEFNGKWINDQGQKFEIDDGVITYVKDGKIIKEVITYDFKKKRFSITGGKWTMPIVSKPTWKDKDDNKVTWTRVEEDVIGGGLMSLEQEVEVDAGFQWGYEKHNGPITWCAHFKDAKGKEQSPIDIKNIEDIKMADDYKVTHHYKNCKAVCLNNSHTVVWSVENAGHIMIGKKQFNLAQFHYHCPSEHYINGKQYPLCLHFVHVAEDGTLAVLGRVYDFGKTGDKFLENVCDNKVIKANDSYTVDSVNFESLNVSGNYVIYPGSLTTPPCSEGVKWHVKDKVDTISHAQHSWFRSCLKFDNARPLQKMNDRTLLKTHICNQCDPAE